MTTQNRGFEEGGPGPLRPADAASATDVHDAQPQERPRREPLDVPVAYAAIDPLMWESDEEVSMGLRCVTVTPKIALEEVVSVSLSSCTSDGYLGQVFFDLTPAEALRFADELREAAADVVSWSGDPSPR